MIAMALALQPQLLIADEPTTALDVTVQAQILRLMQQLQNDLGMAIIFITHNLGVIANMADDVAVMYLGKVVELGTVQQIFHDPQHPYTQALLAAVPKADPGSKLDLTALMQGKASVPSSWPKPFTLDESIVADMIDVGGGHYVWAEVGAQLPMEIRCAF